MKESIMLALQELFNGYAKFTLCLNTLSDEELCDDPECDYCRGAELITEIVNYIEDLEEEIEGLEHLVKFYHGKIGVKDDTQH